MAKKQDPPKKTMKDLLKKAMSSGDRASASQSYQSMARGAVSAILPKTSALKSALAKGDKSSASQAYKSMAAKKAKPNTAKIDSVKKVTVGGGPKSSIVIKKQTTVKPGKPVEKLMPYKPAKKAIIKKMMK
jgi:hypothetical protein